MIPTSITLALSTINNHQTHPKHFPKRLQTAHFLKIERKLHFHKHFIVAKKKLKNNIRKNVNKKKSFFC